MITLTPTHDRFEQLKSSGLLPSPRGAALAVVQLTRRDDVTSAQLAQAIMVDPALLARLLKLANSCRSGASRPVLTIQDTVKVLGLMAVRGLALGFSLMADNRSGACKNFDYLQFWSQSLARAVAMKTLVRFSRVMQADEAFTLGLLAQIGRLALASVYPDEYARLLQAGVDGRLTEAALLQAERAAFELDHTEISAELLTDWGLPDGVVEPARFHEQPAQAQFADGSRAERLLWALALAAHIADLCLAKPVQRAAVLAELPALAQRLDIDTDALPDLCDSVAQEWADWCGLLDVPHGALPPFAELLLAAAPAAAAPAVPASATPLDAPLRVLAVEDDPMMRSLVRALVKHLGFAYLEAVDGKQGLALALAERPQVLIVDWMMPEMNGIEMIRELRKSASGRSCYILLLTGLNHDEHIGTAIDAGADDFLHKPINPRILAARLRIGQRLIALRREIEHDQSSLRQFAAEFGALNLRLQQAGVAASTDPLTGLMQRAAALDWLRQVWPQALPAHPIGALLLRLDQLGAINRSQGRLRGDAALRQFAALLAGNPHGASRLSRYGGACLLLLYIDSSLVKLRQCATHVGQLLALQELQIGGHAATLSVGYALSRPELRSPDALLDAAELALALARRAGGNRISGPGGLEPSMTPA